MDDLRDKGYTITIRYLVSENDRMINPDLERFIAKRIGAKEVVFDTR